jgi:DNA-binding CsgD family transcriptional regulator
MTAPHVHNLGAVPAAAAKLAELDDLTIRQGQVIEWLRGELARLGAELAETRQRIDAHRGQIAHLLQVDGCEEPSAHAPHP